MNTWHKSSYSNTGGQCVEVRETPGCAEVRDTQHREAGHLSFPVSEWSALLRCTTP
ncbi:DUF397 domain-containing protein [Nocardiopsis sp. MG754419]|uniref:DUF397 domain-containing protein n=1 Tax=Nocardiopsis sp. MG754419 TaxID=2259865 RepID=UPI001BA5FF03|nr:DUF397 domain-containing protein [Nocardiopsis sp. MG754419]MBR8744042.1 DUF397 domain-containing protein [Nocardiopsis sp. MG754419]